MILAMWGGTRFRWLTGAGFHLQEQLPVAGLARLQAAHLVRLER